MSMQYFVVATLLFGLLLSIALTLYLLLLRRIDMSTRPLNEFEIGLDSYKTMPLDDERLVEVISLADKYLKLSADFRREQISADQFTKKALISWIQAIPQSASSPEQVLGQLSLMKEEGVVSSEQYVYFRNLIIQST